MRSARALSLALVLLVLSGGVSGAMAKESPAVAPSPAVSTLTARSLSFAEAVHIAALETPAARLAALETDEAQAKLAQSRGAFLPSLDGTAYEMNRTFNRETFGIDFPSEPGQPALPKLIGPFDIVDARLAASQTLFDWSSWAKIRSSRQGLAASRADQSASTETAARDAAAAYLRAARAQAMLGARGSDLVLADSLLALARIQVEAGVSPAIDVARARTQQAASRGGLLVARNQFDRAQIDLSRALGLDPVLRFALTDTLSTSLGGNEVPADLPAAVTLALARRPELKAEAARGFQAREDRSAIAAERLPKLGVNADYGLSGSHANDAIATREVSIGVSVPLFDGLRREARIQEQTAIVRETEIRARDLRDQVSAEVSAALLDIASGLEQERVADERLRLAEDELLQARDRFVSGVAGNIEVINAQAGLIEARDAEIDARFATAIARVNLARATGTTQGLH